MIGPFSTIPGDKLDWRRDGVDWPHRDASRFVRAAGIEHHVQVFEPPDWAAPTVLLLHGTGAATHSWAALAPLLAKRFRVVAPDLPGHGFTETPWFSRLSLPGMAATLGELLETLEIEASAAIGHSAGAAIACRMALDGRFGSSTPLKAIIGLNAALLPIEGPAGVAMPTMAKLLALNPAAPRLFAWGAQSGVNVGQLLAATGSEIGADQHRYYQRLMRSPGHVSAMLTMLSQWDLAPLARDLPRLAVPTTLIAGAADRMVSPAQAKPVSERISDCGVVTLDGLGHLAHEEAAETVAALCLERLGALV